MHNYHELINRSEKTHYWLIDRWKLSKNDRFFFEGCKKLHGQMYIEDRKALYDLIISEKPKTCFEIGTYKGGGSTFFLSSAFAKVGNGKLITLESNIKLHQFAKNFYKKHLPLLEKHTIFLLGSSPTQFLPLIKENKNVVDCVFLDGSDDQVETVEQYKFFIQFFHSGSILMAHDWFTDKMKLLKPIIERDKQWINIKTINPPASVGFVIYQRV